MPRAGGYPIHTITRVEDLPSPLRENWSDARALWKCYVFTQECLPSPRQQQSDALTCWTQVHEDVSVEENLLRAGTKFVSILLQFDYDIESLISPYSWHRIPYFRFGKK
jgi:hypothetical protein